MFITLKEALENGDLDNNAVIIRMQSKLNLHKGHENLINFAKQYGNVTVIIKDFKWLTFWCLESNPLPKPEIDENELEIQIKSIENLGAKAIYEEVDVSNITEKDRINLQAIAREVVLPYESQLILQRKINLCVIHYMYHSRVSRPFFKIGFKYIVAGPEVTPFFIKDIHKTGKVHSLHGWPENYLMYLSVDKDPDTGMKYQFNTNFLSDDQKKKCLDLKLLVDSFRHRFVKGLNTTLVEEINSTYPNEEWKMNDIVILNDGIFGSSELECYSFFMNNVLIEDMTFKL